MQLINLSRGRLYAVMAPRTVRTDLMTHLIARLALVGPVRVLDGGNRFDARGITRKLRRGSRDFYLPLKRILLSRAFTYYQMVTLLEETGPLTIPVLLLDLLATFYDESVHLPERCCLLEHALARLKSLAHTSPVVVSAPHPTSDDELSARLETAADQVWHFEAEAAPIQPRLF